MTEEEAFAAACEGYPALYKRAISADRMEQSLAAIMSLCDEARRAGDLTDNLKRVWNLALSGLKHW